MGLLVHHLQVSQSERIPWLCEELDIPYELKIYKRSPVFSPPELLALTPLGAAPVITVTDDSNSSVKPLVLAESAAVMEYIIQKFGDGRLMLKPDHPDYADYLYWFHFANGNMQPILSRLLQIRRCVPSEDHPVYVNNKGRLTKALGNLNDHLEQKDGNWLAGSEFTAADIIMVFSFTTMRTFCPYSLVEYPAISAWLKRVGQRPAYQKAMSKGDPDANLAELLGANPPPMFPPIAAVIKQG